MLQKLAAAADAPGRIRAPSRRPALGRGQAPRARGRAPSSPDRDLSLRGPRLPHRRGARGGRAAGALHLRAVRRAHRRQARAIPSIDPHGHSIPTLDGEMSEQNSIPLTEVQQEGTFVIDSVSDRDASTLQQFKASGIRPGADSASGRTAPLKGYSVSIGRSPRPLTCRMRPPAISGLCAAQNNRTRLTRQPRCLGSKTENGDTTAR